MMNVSDSEFLDSVPKGLIDTVSTGESSTASFPEAMWWVWYNLDNNFSYANRCCKPILIAYKMSYIC